MKTAKQLKEERGEKLEKANALVSKAKGENRSLTKEEGDSFDALTAEIDTLDKEIERAERAEKLAAQAAKPVDTSVRSGLSDREVKDFSKFSLMRGLQLHVEGKALDGIEAEVHAIAKADAQRNGIALQGFGVPAFVGEKRGQTVTGQTSVAGDQGGVTVPTELNGLQDALWQKSFLGQVGATRLAGLMGNQDFMVQDTVPTIATLTEIESITPGEIKFSKFSMAPERKGASIPFSKQLLIQSSLDVEALVLENLRKALDYKLNVDAYTSLAAAVVSGNGNLVALGTNGAAPTYDDVVGLEALIETFETGQGSLKYLTNSKVKAKLKRTQQFSSTNGKPVYENGLINEYQAVISNIIPSNLTKGTASGVCSALYFGDFSMLYLGMWGGADFVVDGFTKAATGEVIITCNMYWQTKIARAKSFAGIKDALTA